MALLGGPGDAPDLDDGGDGGPADGALVGVPLEAARAAEAGAEVAAGREDGVLAALRRRVLTGAVYFAPAVGYWLGYFPQTHVYWGS